MQSTFPPLSFPSGYEGRHELGVEWQAMGIGTKTRTKTETWRKTLSHFSFSFSFHSLELRDLLQLGTPLALS